MLDLLLSPFSLFSKKNADELQCSGEDCEVTWVPKKQFATKFTCINCLGRKKSDGGSDPEVHR